MKDYWSANGKDDAPIPIYNRVDPTSDDLGRVPQVRILPKY